MKTPTADYTERRKEQKTEENKVNILKCIVDGSKNQNDSNN